MTFINIAPGRTSRAAEPIVAVWFIHAGLTIITAIALIVRGGIPDAIRRIRSAWRPVTLETLFDTTAWIAYATAVQTAPISLTIAITESYIALATLLGILVNRERLARH